MKRTMRLILVAISILASISLSAMAAPNEEADVDEIATESTSQYVETTQVVPEVNTDIDL